MPFAVESEHACKAANNDSEPVFSYQAPNTWLKETQNPEIHLNQALEGCFLRLLLKVLEAVSFQPGKSTLQTVFQPQPGLFCAAFSDPGEGNTKPGFEGP